MGYLKAILVWILLDFYMHNIPTSEADTSYIEKVIGDTLYLNCTEFANSASSCGTVIKNGSLASDYPEKVRFLLWRRQRSPQRYGKNAKELTQVDVDEKIQFQYISPVDAADGSSCKLKVINLLSNDAGRWYYALWEFTGGIFQNTLVFTTVKDVFEDIFLEVKNMTTPKKLLFKDAMVENDTVLLNETAFFKEFDQVEVQCDALDGYPVITGVTTEWMKDGVQVSTNGTLLIANFTSANEGNYSCVKMYNGESGKNWTIEQAFSLKILVNNPHSSTGTSDSGDSSNIVILVIALIIAGLLIILLCILLILYVLRRNSAQPASTHKESAGHISPVFHQNPEQVVSENEVDVVPVPEGSPNPLVIDENAEVEYYCSEDVPPPNTNSVVSKPATHLEDLSTNINTKNNQTPGENELRIE